MQLVVIDLETTGTDPKTCLPIEFACQSYDTVTKDRGAAYSQLIWEPTYPTIAPLISELTGITQKELEERGKSRDEVLNDILLEIKDADVLCAYNAQFDREVLEGICHEVADSFRIMKPWYCAMSEHPFPDNMQKCRKLSHRALDLGLKMDGRNLHRAMSDVNLVCDIFDLFDMEEVMRYWQIPSKYILAQIPKPWEDGGKGVDKVKQFGFGWEFSPGESAPKFPKSWVKKVKVNENLEKFPFTILDLKDMK